jgi:membrane protease YdiL (CAAX protease family)
MLIVIIAVIGILLREKSSFKQIGLRFDNILSAIPFYSAVVFISVLSVIILARFFGMSFITNWRGYYHFYGVFFILAFAEVFLYLGFLLPHLETLLKNPLTAIIINSAMFSLMHIIYPNNFFLLPAFFFGLVISTAYYFRPNLVVAGITLAIANFAAVLYGFV